MMRGTGRETLGRFVDALAAEDQRRADGWEPIWHSLRMGFDAEQLRRYDDLFAPDQLRVVLYDDVEERPDEVLSRALPVPRRGRRLCSGHVAAPHRVARPAQLGAAPHGRTLRSSARREGGRPHARARLRRDLQEQNLVRPTPLDLALRAQLETFRPDILELQGRLGRDLGAWVA
ncbi:MAG TPA: hypothetical protein VI462_07885 [Acidimicrobiia bacterium]